MNLGERLLHLGLGGLELFDFPAGGEGPLRDRIERLRWQGWKRLSFHAPMPRPGWLTHPGVACFLLHEDEALLELSLGVVEASLRAAREWNAAYVVTHLTYGPTDTRDSRLAQRRARAACARLAELSAGCGVPIDVEFAAYSEAFHRARDFVGAIAEHPELGICLDTGHAAQGARTWQRSYLADVETLAPFTRSMHLWNTRGLPGEGHVPLHPRQRPADGWIDIEASLRPVLEVNPAVSIIFEYPVETVTPEIQAGYDWVAGIVRRPE